VETYPSLPTLELKNYTALFFQSEMGSGTSVEMEKDEQECLQYICSRSDTRSFSVDSVEDNVKVGVSKIENIVPSFPNGLFAKRNIPSGTKIVFSSHPLATTFNDCMFDYSLVREATNGDELFAGIVKIRQLYYDKEKAARRVNVIARANVERETWYETCRFVAKGEELVRMYGFSTWLKELAELNVLTVRNIDGLLRYIEQVAVQKQWDPFHAYFDVIVKKIPVIRAANEKTLDKDLLIQYGTDKQSGEFVLVIASNKDSLFLRAH
jgi:hypothetical protein